MDSLLVMFEACTDSPAYMRLDSEQEAAAAVLSIMGDNPELEELVNAHTYTAKQEGFVNGWAWAQATARECLALRKLPVLVENYGPDRRCGTCGWFVQHYRYTGAYPGLLWWGVGIVPTRRQKRASHVIRFGVGVSIGGPAAECCRALLLWPWISLCSLVVRFF